MDVLFLALLCSLPVLLVVSGWGGIAFALFVLMAGCVALEPLSGDPDLGLAESPYGLAVVYLLGINAAVLLGRCGALLQLLGARREPRPAKPVPKAAVSDEAL